MTGLVGVTLCVARSYRAQPIDTVVDQANHITMALALIDLENVMDAPGEEPELVSIRSNLDLALRDKSDATLASLCRVLESSALEHLLNIKVRIANVLNVVGGLVREGSLSDVSNVVDLIRRREAREKQQNALTLSELSIARRQFGDLGRRSEAGLIVNTRRRLDELHEQILQELRQARSLLAQMQRCAPDPDQSKIKRALTLYHSALLAEVGQITGKMELEGAWADESTTYPVLKVPVPERLYQNIDALLDAEERAHDRVRATDPSLVGFFAIRYQPVPSEG